MKREDIMATLREPDSVLPSEGRLIYQKQLGKKLLRIVTEGNILVTVYGTSQMKRYTKARLP